MFWTCMFAMMAKAQPNLAFYPLEDQFNSFDYNPAFLSSREKFTFSIFPLAGVSVGFNNQGVIRDLASKFMGGVITNEDYKNAFDNMVDQSSFQQSVEASLLSFTYRSNSGFFNFRIKDSEYFVAKVQGDITQFIFKSDIRSAAIEHIQSLPAQSAHYREYSLGYSFKSRNNRLTAGIRAKLLFGKFAFFSNMQGSIQEDMNSPGDFVLKTSGLLDISFIENTIKNPNDSTNVIDFSDSKTVVDYIFNTGNPGVGIDLGFQYQVSPALSVSMSVIDLGKINWKSNLNSRSLEKEYPLPYSTYGIDDTEGGQIITKRENYMYSDSFDFSKLTRQRAPFSKPLPTSFYAGLKYQVTPDLSFSITDRYRLIKDLGYNHMSLTANVDVTEKLSVSTGYAAMSDAYLNIPLALLYQGEFGQIFLGTDNLTSIFFPTATQFAGISFGACFFLFKERKLHGNPSEQTPFYRPRKIIKNPKSGLIIRNDPKR